MTREIAKSLDNIWAGNIKQLMGFHRIVYILLGVRADGDSDHRATSTVAVSEESEYGVWAASHSS